MDDSTRTSGISANAALPPIGQIGPYTLLQTLGEGGMGTVYLAEQTTPVKRRVALKVIKLGMDTREVVTRFEAERQALAVMDHPGIARVFDGGATEAGRPFFVMELVQGEPIAQFCDRASMPVRDRVALFIDVCHAVQHAHQKGIVHRDLKPSNVLVTMQDGRPASKIIDFGIAKAIETPLTDETFATGVGQFVGTPAYMSPEQLGLTGQDVDTRADIYSLGVLLYELLAGTRPFEPRELEAGRSLVDAVKSDDPPKPSARLSSVRADARTRIAASRQTDATTLRRLLERDLDWIALKAIEKDRARRYDTANTLAGDLQRYLSNEPVTARPPSRSYWVRKFVARHRFGVAAAATILLVMVGSAGVIAAQAARVVRERDRATLEAAKATTINEFLQDMLSSADPTATGSRTVTVVDALAAAERRLDTALVTQPEVASALRRTLAGTYRGLGEWAHAEKILRASADKNRASGRRQDLALDLGDLGNVLRDEGKYDEALAAEREAIDIGRGSGVAPERIANFQFVLAETLRQRGEYDAAQQLASQVLDERMKMVGPDSGELGPHQRQLGTIAAAKGDFALAERLYQQSLETERRHRGPRHPRTVGVLNDLGAMYIEKGEFEKALATYQEITSIQRETLGNAHPELASSLENLANVQYRMKRYPEATGQLEEVLTIRKQAFGEESMPVARTTFNLGMVYTTVGDLAKADQTLPDGVARLRRALGSEHPDLVAALRGVSALREAQGRLPEAEATARESVTLALKTIGPDHLGTATSHQRLGRLLLARKKYAEAEPQLLRVRAIRETSLGASARPTQDAVADLVKLYSAWGQPGKAKALGP
jgi:serine/threonine protein kinase/lipopolysaccharide biosynthesis regulator YciM